MKKLIFLLCVFALICVNLLSVSAATPDSGTVNSTALSYFEGIVDKLPANSDYVVFKSGDYESTLFYGFDFELTDSQILCTSDCTQVIYDSRASGSNYNYYPEITQTSINGFTLNYNNASILYSSVGSWASLGNPLKDIVSYVLWSIVFLIFIFIVFKMIRNRRHYLNL